MPCARRRENTPLVGLVNRTGFQRAMFWQRMALQLKARPAPRFNLALYGTGRDAAQPCGRALRPRFVLAARKRSIWFVAEAFEVPRYYYREEGRRKRRANLSGRRRRAGLGNPAVDYVDVARPNGASGSICTTKPNEFMERKAAKDRVILDPCASSKPRGPAEE